MKLLNMIDDSGSNPNHKNHMSIHRHNALLVAKWAMETKRAIASGVRCAFAKHKLLALILVAPPLIDTFVAARSGGNNATRERVFNSHSEDEKLWLENSR
jgi:hypothetical protein